jgi:deoxycytidylate deaminase
MDDRPPFEEIYMKMAVEVSRRSTCRRTNSAGELMKVGCVITTTDFRKVVALGYNGNASGLPNGCDSEEPGKCGCFISGTRILPTWVHRAYKRRYTGDVIRVITTVGDFTVTPNHPILTLGGWTAAEQLCKGENLFGTLGSEQAPLGAPHDEKGVPIEQIFEALLVAGGRRVRHAGARHDFHGDGVVDEEVDVVSVNRGLWTSRQALRLKQVEKPPFARTGVVPPSLSRLGAGPELVPAIIGDESSFNEPVANHDDTDFVFSSQGDCGDPLLVFSNDVFGRDGDHRFPLVPAEVLGNLAQDSRFAQALLYRRMGDPLLLRQFEHCAPSQIAAHKVLHVERQAWSGHVYNLETSGNWYALACGGILAHNCLHAECNAVVNCDVPRQIEKVVFATHLPCVHCAKMLINLGGVKLVYYLNDYRIRDSVALLTQAGIPMDEYPLPGGP